MSSSGNGPKDRASILEDPSALPASRMCTGVEPFRRGAVVGPGVRRVDASKPSDRLHRAHGVGTPHAGRRAPKCSLSDSTHAHTSSELPARSCSGSSSIRVPQPLFALGPRLLSRYVERKKTYRSSRLIRVVLARCTSSRARRRRVLAARTGMRRVFECSAAASLAHTSSSAWEGHAAPRHQQDAAPRAPDARGQHPAWQMPPCQASPCASQNPEPSGPAYAVGWTHHSSDMCNIAAVHRLPVARARMYEVVSSSRF
ncbi:hypothetical protein C8Q79DRAFT_148605 [Trametes meyenii]|nr:hypothetical protein C8Q79DRAFT_148605 [Trametes meyenii]